MELYTVVSLWEKDFGCEGRPEGQKSIIEAVLEDENGKSIKIDVFDEDLLRENINEGDIVKFADEGKKSLQFVKNDV